LLLTGGNLSLSNFLLYPSNCIAICSNVASHATLIIFDFSSSDKHEPSKCVEIILLFRLFTISFVLSITDLSGSGAATLAAAFCNCLDGGLDGVVGFSLIYTPISVIFSSLLNLTLFVAPLYDISIFLMHSVFPFILLILTLNISPT